MVNGCSFKSRHEKLYIFIITLQTQRCKLLIYLKVCLVPFFISKQNLIHCLNIFTTDLFPTLFCCNVDIWKNDKWWNTMLENSIINLKANMMANVHRSANNSISQNWFLLVIACSKDSPKKIIINTLASKELLIRRFSWDKNERLA